MEASVVDLRYRTTEVISALDRNESVSIYYHGTLKGIINPVMNPNNKKVVMTHSFFGMNKNDAISVEEQIDNLRSVRV